METMTVADVADLMQVTQPTVDRWVRDGALPATRIGRTLRFNRADVESMVSGDEAMSHTETRPGDSTLVTAITDVVVAEMKRRGLL